MSPKEKSIKLFIILFVLILAFGIIGSCFLKDYKVKNSPEKFVEESIQTQTSYETFPQVVNLYTESVSVGSNFNLTPRIVPSEGNINLTLLGGPEWLNLEGGVLYGIPDKEGTEEFTLRIERDGKYIDQEFFLIVTDELNE